MIKGNKAKLINQTFQILLVTYLVLLLLEQLISAPLFINLNYLLIIVILLGILDVLSEKQEILFYKPKKEDYMLTILLGILGFLIIKFKTQSLGWLSWIISLIAGILITLLGILILEDDE